MGVTNQLPNSQTQRPRDRYVGAIHACGIDDHPNNAKMHLYFLLFFFGGGGHICIVKFSCQLRLRAPVTRPHQKLMSFFHHSRLFIFSSRHTRAADHSDPDSWQQLFPFELGVGGLAGRVADCYLIIEQFIVRRPAQFIKRREIRRHE